jgi:tetratricopeptide (TPR) repeat protein
VSEGLYERYKDALRRGHVATLRERFGEAIVAYEEAAELAPDRALPYSSLGRVLDRLGRPEDALSAYGVALERAAGDEVALAGRAEVLVRLDRRVEAAETLVRLAESHDAAGRLADACDVARRALELAESRPRRRFVERLVGQLRDAAGDEAAIAAMERALRILEPAVAPAVETAAVPGFAQPPDPEALIGEADALLAAGDRSAARERYLEAAAAYRVAGQLDAALDACLPILGLEPADPAVHLVLADLYTDRAWHAHAAEKLRLLGRLAALTGDAETERRLAELAAASGSGVSVAAPPPD